MEDNYRFLREKNLDELYACVCEVENLYKKGMYKQIPQECRKALEIEIEDFCDYYNIKFEEHTSLFEKAKTIKFKKYFDNEEFWDDFFEIRTKGNCASHYKKDRLTNPNKVISQKEKLKNSDIDTKDKAVILLKILHRHICDYFKIKYHKEITEPYQLPEQEKDVEKRFDTLNNRIQELEKNFEHQMVSMQKLLKSSQKATENASSKQTSLYKNNPSSELEKHLHEAQQNYNYKNYKEAVENWYKVLKLEPDYELDYFLLATAEREAKKFNEAIKHFSFYIKNNPKSIYLAQAYNKRGWCYEQLEKWKEAQADYEKAHELNPKINNTRRLENKFRNSGVADISVELSNELLTDYKSKNVPDLLQKIDLEQEHNVSQNSQIELASIYHNERANKYYENEDYQGAIDEWNRVLQIDTNFAIDYLRFALAEDEIGEYDNAVEYYSKFIKNNPNSENLDIAYNKRGYIYEQLERFIDAKNDYKNALKIAPDNEFALSGLNRLEQKMEEVNENISNVQTESAEDYNVLGNRCYNNGDYSEAIENYNKAIELDTNEPLYYNNRADAYYECKKYQEAVNDWNKVLELNPEYEIDYSNFNFAKNKINNCDKKDSDVTIESQARKIVEKYGILMEDAVELLNLGTYEEVCEALDEAEAEYEANEKSKAVNLNNNSPSYYDNQANTYYENENYQEAVDNWNKVLELDLDYKIDYFKFAYSAYEIGDYDNALHYYDMSILDEPEQAVAYNNRGLIWQERNQYDKAIKDYSKAIELDENEPLYYNNRADVYYEVGNYQEAVDDWHKVLELDSDYEIDYFDLATAEDEIEDYNNALKHFNYNSNRTRYNEQESGHLNEHIEEARNCIRNENFEATISICENILKSDSENEIAYHYLGISYYQLGNYDKALGYYRKAIKLAPNYAKPYCNIGLIKQAQGKIGGAIKYYDKALELDPNLLVALQNKENCFKQN